MVTKKDKTPIVIMIGGGSKLPKILSAAKSPQSKYYISLVISHKKDSIGVRLALKNNIPAIYMNLVNWQNQTHKSRGEYMKYLGWFISQTNYKPKLLVFAGWDLVMDNYFFRYFKADFGNGYSAINLHPALMPLKGNKSVTLPDSSTIPVIKGEQEDVLKTVIKNKHTFFGPSVHFMKPTQFDTGEVIKRQFIKVGESKTIAQLRKKLLPVEDEILISSINLIVKKYL